MVNVTEAYSTITCSCCLHVTRIGWKKVFQCSNKECRARMPRDVNAARCILIFELIRIASYLEKHTGNLRALQVGQEKLEARCPPVTGHPSPGG